jgi:hypothetical protein
MGGSHYAMEIHTSAHCLRDDGVKQAPTSRKAKPHIPDQTHPLWLTSSRRTIHADCALAAPLRIRRQSYRAEQGVSHIDGILWRAICALLTCGATNGKIQLAVLCSKRSVS